MSNKKWVGMIVLVMLVLTAVPLALGEKNGLGNDLAERVKEKVQEAEEDDEGSKGSAEAGEETSGKMEREREVLQEKRREIKEETKQKIKELRGKFEEAKAGYRSAKELLQERKSVLTELKQKVQDCQDGEECKLKKTELRKGVRNHLRATLNVIDRSLAQIGSRVADSEALSEEQKEEALAALAEAVAKVGEKKEAIAALPEDATNEELKAAIKELKDAWREIKQTQQWVLASLMNSKIDALVEKHENYVLKMAEKISRLEEEGLDVGSLVELKNEFQAKLEVLKEDKAVLDEKWLAFKTSDDKKEALKQMLEAQKKVKEDLKEMQELLKQFVRKNQELQKEVKPESAEKEEEAEEEESPASGSEGAAGTTA